jgi:hypothetical protein
MKWHGGIDGEFEIGGVLVQTASQLVNVLRTTPKILPNEARAAGAALYFFAIREFGAEGAEPVLPRVDKALDAIFPDLRGASHERHVAAGMESFVRDLFTHRGEPKSQLLDSAFALLRIL